MQDTDTFRADTRAWLQANCPESMRQPITPDEMVWSGSSVHFGSEDQRLWFERMRDRGWFAPGWPAALGGGGLTPRQARIVEEEMLRLGCRQPQFNLGVWMLGPVLLELGTEAQKQEHLVPMMQGRARWCQGFSEPNAGSDLASVRTRAVPNDQGWLLNGQKIWTTNAQHCQYMIALVRTSGEAADRQKGLSQVIVDLSLPGVTVRPIEDMSGDSHFCEVFFDNVQLGADALIGAEGQGWEQVTAELAFERSGPERLFSSIVLFDQWLAFVRTEKTPRPESLRLAGQILTRLAPLRALSVAVQEKLVQGQSPIVEAALVKDQGTVLEQFIPTAIADDVMARVDETIPSALLMTLNYLTLVAPSYTLRGGTRSILRGMIARGLGLR